ncbi:hypothetical protein E2320_021515 [Naja naja]|nr:hypothetical protein E2320_021515 [Naja naja]
METMRSSWNSFLPLTIALFVGVVDCQRDLAARLDPYPSFRTDAGNREMTQLRFQQNQGRFGPRTKVHSLFQVHDSSSTLDHVPVTPQTNAAANARMRIPAGRELRKQNSAPTAHRLPSLTSVRSQSSNPRRSTGVLSRGPSWTLQQRTPSVNLVRNGPRPRTAPQVQTARGRMVG